MARNKQFSSVAPIVQQQYENAQQPEDCILQGAQPIETQGDTLCVRATTTTAPRRAQRADAVTARSHAPAAATTTVTARTCTRSSKYSRGSLDRFCAPLRPASVERKKCSQILIARNFPRAKNSIVFETYKAAANCNLNLCKTV